MSANTSATDAFALHSPEFIKLLANDIRWRLLKALIASDYRVNELVAILQQPMNLISYHLKMMRDNALVNTRRSDADGRDVYYSLDLNRLRQLYFQTGNALHPTIGVNSPIVEVLRLKHQRILFVCSHNSARSQMAEGLLRHLSQGYLNVSSAGSDPMSIHPDAVRIMQQIGVDISQQRPRALSDFVGQEFDYVITVCDKAREICPAFPGTGIQLHWGFSDPVIIEDEEERAALFRQIAQQLTTRIEYFLSTLPIVSSRSEA